MFVGFNLYYTPYIRLTLFEVIASNLMIFATISAPNATRCASLLDVLSLRAVKTS
jgi:hypothetical protein